MLIALGIAPAWVQLFRFLTKPPTIIPISQGGISYRPPLDKGGLQGGFEARNFNCELR